MPGEQEAPGSPRGGVGASSSQPRAQGCGAKQGLPGGGAPGSGPPGRLLPTHKRGLGGPGSLMPQTPLDTHTPEEGTPTGDRDVSVTPLDPVSTHGKQMAGLNKGSAKSLQRQQETEATRGRTFCTGLTWTLI